MKSSRFNAPTLPAISLCLLAFPALVGAVEADSPWYFDFRVGEVRTVAGFGTVHPKHFADEAAAYTVELGCELTPHLAVQIGFSDLGRHTGEGSACPEDVDICVATLCVEGEVCDLVASPLTVDIATWTMAAVPSLDITERFSLHAKVGVATWSADVSGLLATRSTERFSGTDLVAGVGARYALSRGLGLVLEHSRSEPEVRSTSLGMSWRF